jgi:hypothetical protein
MNHNRDWNYRGERPDGCVMRLTGHAARVLSGHDDAKARDIWFEVEPWREVRLTAQERAEIERRHQCER